MTKAESSQLLRDEDALAVLRHVPDVASAVADAIDELGTGFVVGADVLAPAARGRRACGPAITLRYRRLCADVDEVRSTGMEARLGDRDLYATARGGEVAIFDCPGAPDSAVLGAISAHWAALAGLSGVVVSGAIRDSVSVVGTGLPVWSRARVPRAARYRFTTAAIGEPVRLAGNVVHPGDIVIADDDGVCVVPSSSLAAVAQICADGDAVERELLERIRSCSSIEELQAKSAPAEFDR